MVNASAKDRPQWRPCCGHHSRTGALPQLQCRGRHEDEVRHAIDVIQFGLAIPTLTMINQPSQAISFSSGIHAGVVGEQRDYTDTETFNLLGSCPL